MERGNVVVIAIVVAALALFGLRFFGSDPEVDELAGLSPRERVARLGAQRSGEGGALGDSRGAVDGRSGGSSRPGAGGSRSGSYGPGGGAAGSGGAGGSAGTVYGAGGSGGGSVGTSGSSRAGGAGGSGSIASLDSRGRVAPQAERRENLVESLGSRPPTQSDLDQPVQPVDDGDDVALKVNSQTDIVDQQGQQLEVEDADDGAQGIEIPEDGRVEFPNAGNASGDGGTISFKITPEWSGADQTDNALVQIRQEHEWNNRLELVKNGEFLRFIITDDTGREADISARISNWESLQEHEIRASWGEGKTTLYIDGQVVGQNQYQGNLRFREGTPMFLGADWRGSNYNGAAGKIGDFTLSTTPSHP